MEEAPKLVMHTLCGEPIFYYFGNTEDAKQLRNFNDITTLEGDAITPEDITKCRGCGEKIRINQIQVAVNDDVHIKFKDGEKEIPPDYNSQVREAVWERFKNQKLITTHPTFKDNKGFLWNNDDDPSRIHKDKPK